MAEVMECRLIPIGIATTMQAAFLEGLSGYVRERRRANGLTQAELALLAGVGRRFVSELENAKPTLQVGKVDAVLAVFGKCLGLVDRERAAVAEVAGQLGARSARGRRA